MEPSRVFSNPTEDEVLAFLKSEGQMTKFKFYGFYHRIRQKLEQFYELLEER